MKTEDLITSLSGDLAAPSTSRNWFSQFWFSWISCFCLFSILTYLAAAFLPEEIHLPMDLKNPSFWLRNAFWFAFSVLSALIAYQSSIPGKLKPVVTKLGIAAGVAALGILFTESAPWQFLDELQALNIKQGPCGLFILLTSLSASMWIFYILRRAAPTQLGFTGAWTAASIGSLSSFFMNLVCTHESSQHVFVWHLLPVFLLIAMGMQLGKSFLRW